MVTKTIKKLAKWEICENLAPHISIPTTWSITVTHARLGRDRQKLSEVRVQPLQFRIADRVFFFFFSELPLNGWKPLAKQSSKNFATVSTACLSCCVDNKQQFNIIMVYRFLNKYFSFIWFSLFFFHRSLIPTYTMKLV